MFSRSVSIPLILFILSFATIALAIIQSIQIPMGALPEDSMRLAAVPYTHFVHAFGGAMFGLIGPLQFGRVLAKKFGRIHRVLGRLFVLSGAGLALSSFSLLWHFPESSAMLVSGGRLLFGMVLAVSLFLALHAIKRRDFDRHRDWMIRAYAAGIGATAVSNVFIPIYAITGEPPTGVAADIAFIGSWAVCLVIAEGIIRAISSRRNQATAKPPTP